MPLYKLSQIANKKKLVILIVLTVLCLLAVTIYLWSVLPQPILVFSIPIRLAAFITAVVACFYWKDLRTLPLALMFFLMALRQTLTLYVVSGVIERTSLTIIFSEVPGFIVTLLSLLSIIYLWNLFSFREKMRVAEKKLDFSNEKFKIMVDFSSDWEAWRLPDGSYEYISPSCKQVTGYTQTEFIDKPDLLLTITHPDDRELVTEHHSQHFLPETESEELKFRIITKGGDLRWIWHKCCPVILKSGEWQGRRISNRDITESKQFETKLKKREKQLKNAQQIAKMGHWKLDLRNNRFDWSDEVFRIFSLDPRQVEISFESFLEMVHPDDREMLNNAYTESLENRSKYDFEHRIVLKNGSEKWVCETCSTQYDNNGDPLYSFGIVQDITEKHYVEDQVKINTQLQSDLKRLESLKTMAGAIAHRFNNSMTAVLGNLELLEMTIAPDSPEKKNVSSALQVAREASQVGSLMLTYVGQRAMQRGLVDLVVLTRSVTVELENQFTPSISLRFTPSSEPLHCSMDSLQIKEVISSVITNAVESLQDATGTVEISFGTEKFAISSFPVSFQSDDLKDGLYSFCQIRDTGNGIDIEDLLRIFEPFFTTKFVGRGLGLALTVGIMRAHNGALTVESIPEQGTTVRILLPVTTG